MNIPAIFARAQKLTLDNSPAILTAVGAAGALTTAYLTGKASFKAAQMIQHEKERRNLHEKGKPLETKEAVKLVWTQYIPPAGSLIITVGAIVMANRITARRAAALAAAYSLSEKAFGEYREKIVERMGVNKERAARDELAQDRVTNNPASTSGVIITGGGEVLCFDQFTGRYFMSTMEQIKKAQNDINYRIINTGYASLGEFYEKLGLPTTSFAEEVGWADDTKLELLISTVLSEDQKPCIAIDFNISPIRDYYKAYKR